ncbi:iron-siderophore ABC transporter substrate-binding protein [Streptomyces capparidis]
MRPPTRRAALAAAVLALLTAACGSSDSGEGGEGAASTRTVRTAKGPVKVPQSPKRVVVLDTAELDSALTLGVTPVGATRADVAGGFLGYLGEERTEGIEDVGTIGQPNLEAIAALRPDLILTNGARDADRYDELTAIAPTVMTETTGHPWKENFQVHADALNKKAEAAKVVAAYRDHAAKVTKAAGGAARAKQTEVSVVRFVEGANTRLYGRQSYIGTILADVGLGRPKTQDIDEMMVEISPEKADLAAGDVIFHSTYGDPDKARRKEVTGGALWKNLEAVRADRVFAVEDELWIQGIGYTAAGRILDELQRALTRS